MKNIAVFASGTGSNFQAIHEAIEKKEIDAKITLLVSDRPKSKAVEKANSYGLNCFAFRPKAYKSKMHYEKAILSELKAQKVDLIVLAGYMRLIGETILKAYAKRIINIHPSLLPRFKGIDAIGQAMNAQVRVAGVTVHYVDEGMDTGEIISQQELDISSMRTRDEIEKEIHKVEHKLYPKTLKKILEDL